MRTTLSGRASNKDRPFWSPTIDDVRHDRIRLFFESGPLGHARHPFLPPCWSHIDRQILPYYLGFCSPQFVGILWARVEFSNFPLGASMPSNCPFRTCTTQLCLKTFRIFILAPPPPGGSGGGSGLSFSQGIRGFGPIPARIQGVIFFDFYVGLKRS